MADTATGPLVTTATSELLRQRRRALSGHVTPFKDWAERVPEVKAGKMDWERFPFQVELYDQRGALDHDMCVRKATQLGLSAWALRWLLYHVDMHTRTGLYVFPTLGTMHDFAAERVATIIQQSAYLSRRVPKRSIANKGQRQVGVGWAYFRGSETKTQLDSIAADALVLDEYDTLNQENIPDAERRVTGSESGMIRRIGVPSIPNWGIDRIYRRSDRRVWMVKCDRCGHYQEITYGANVHEGAMAEDETYPDAHIVCDVEDGCGKPLDVSQGEWVAEFPDRNRRGYHVTRLIAPRANLSQIVEAHQMTDPNAIKIHHNKDLGLAYAEEEGMLSLEALERAERAVPNPARDIPEDQLRTMGVDVASKRSLNVRVSAHPAEGISVPLFVGKVENFGEVAQLIDRYEPHMTAIDHEPEYRAASALRDKYPGRVWLVRYSGTVKEAFVPDDDMKEVTVQRTRAIDATFEAIRRQRRMIPKKRPTDYNAQMQALVRIVEEDAGGRKIPRYEKIERADDYAHAEVYDMVAENVYYWVSDVAEAVEGETVPFEQMYDFERSELDRETTQGKQVLDEYDGGFNGTGEVYEGGWTDD